MINSTATLDNDALARASLVEMMNRIDQDIDRENLWEQELDILGIAASSEALYELISRAPNTESPLVHYLMGYLLSLEVNPETVPRAPSASIDPSDKSA